MSDHRALHNAHGIVNEFHNVRRGQDAGDAALFGQNRKRVFFVIGNLVNTVVDLLVFETKG